MNVGEWTLLVAVLALVVSAYAIWASHKGGEEQDARLDELGHTQVGTNRKLEGIHQTLNEVEERGRRIDRRLHTEIAIHLCENLNYGTVLLSAHPVGIHPVVVVRVEILYCNGERVVPPHSLPYPVRLDSSAPPEHADVSGPWVDLVNIEPPLLLEQGNEKGGVQGLVLTTSDGEEHLFLDRETSERLVHCAAKALSAWVELGG